MDQTMNLTVKINVSTHAYAWCENLSNKIRPSGRTQNMPKLGADWNQNWLSLGGHQTQTCPGIGASEIGNGSDFGKVDPNTAPERNSQWTHSIMKRNIVLQA